jgi:hypothetical protein
MNPIRPILPALALAVALGLQLGAPSPARAGANSRHFDLVNATFDSVVALAISPSGRDAFQDIALGQPLQGGLTSMTFDVPAGGCMRDLRVTFGGGHTRIFSHIDVCRSTGLRLMPRGGGVVPS